MFAFSLLCFTMNRKNFGYFIILFLAICFWGLSYVFTKDLLGVVTPIALIFFRMVISSALLIVVCSLFFRQRLRNIPRKDWFYLFCLSLFEPFLYFLCETYSLKFTDPTVVAVIIATIPVFTVFLSFFYFKERLCGINFAGVFISVIGILVMLLPKFSDVTFSKWGILLAFCAVIASVGYSFFLKKLDDRYHSVFIVTCQNTIGVLLFLPLFILFHSPAEIQTQIANLLDPHILLNVTMLAVFCSALAFVFYVLAMQKLGLAKANTFTNLIPVVTAVFSFSLGYEQLAARKILGTVIVIVGICMVQHISRQKTDEVSAH